jgi:hypothetical protein
MAQLEQPLYRHVILRSCGLQDPLRDRCYDSPPPSMGSRRACGTAPRQCRGEYPDRCSDDDEHDEEEDGDRVVHFGSQAERSE